MGLLHGAAPRPRPLSPRGPGRRGGAAASRSRRCAPSSSSTSARRCRCAGPLWRPWRSTPRDVAGDDEARRAVAEESESARRACDRRPTRFGAARAARRRARRVTRVAVVSDTHLPRGTRRLPDECVARLAAADVVLHAGDFVRLSVLRGAEEPRAARPRRARQRRRAELRGLLQAAGGAGRWVLDRARARCRPPCRLYDAPAFRLRRRRLRALARADRTHDRRARRRQSGSHGAGDPVTVALHGGAASSSARSLQSCCTSDRHERVFALP